VKKILIPVMALLVLFIITPVLATPATKTPFTAVLSFVPVSPGKQWITEDGISHVKGGIFEGTVTGISGPDISGTMWMSVDETVDLNTGEGSLHGKWTITAIGGTFEGSAVGVITPTSPTTSYMSGTFIGHGAGDYEGQKIKGSFEGDVIVDVYPIELDMEGIILSPKG
jgi:hypothetical protein